MIYKLDKIIADTRLSLGFAPSAAPALINLPSEQDTLRHAIISQLEGTVARIHSEAAPHLLWPGIELNEEICWDDADAWGWMMLPRDFLRLIVFEMDDWSTPVYATITADDAAYELQRSAWPGVRGSWQRPVVAILNRPEGLTLEFYSCKSKHPKVKRAAYLPIPKIDAHGGIDICQQCYPDVIAALAQHASQML